MSSLGHLWHSPILTKKFSSLSQGKLFFSYQLCIEEGEMSRDASYCTRGMCNSSQILCLNPGET